MDKDDIKEAVANAVVAMGSNKFFLVAVSDAAEGKFIFQQQMSYNETATAIKGVLSMNEMLMMDVLQWCTGQIQQTLEKTKNKGSIINLKN